MAEGPPSLSDPRYSGGGGGSAPKPIGVPEGYVRPGGEIDTDPFGIYEGIVSAPPASPDSPLDRARGDTGNILDTRPPPQQGRGDTGNIMAPRQPQTPNPDPGRFTVPLPDVEPRYFEGYELTPAGWRREDVAELQRGLATVGLLTGDFSLGRWQQDSQKAFNQLLGYSNATGQSWTSALQDLSASEAVTVDDYGNIVGRGGDEVEEADRYVRGRYIPGDFQADAYMKPDSASLTQRIKEQFRQVLGRNPREGELGTYVAGLAKADREAYQANTAAAEQQFQSSELARERAFLQGDTEQERQYVESGGRPDDEPAPGLPGMEQPGEVQGVDPIAQFRERFERDYAGSIARNERIGEATEGRQSLMQSILGMDAAIGAR